MHKKPSNGHWKKIVKAGSKLASATLLSRILGLIREQIYAAFFGASGAMDAFNVAMRFPSLLRELFAEGAFSSAFIPVFTKSMKLGEKEAKVFLKRMFLLLLFMTLSCSALLAYFAPTVVSLMAPSFRQDPEKFELTVTLLRILSPFIPIISLSALFVGALNTLKVFFTPALAPALSNLVIILCVIGLSHYFTEQGMPAVFAISFGVVLGGLSQLLLTGGQAFIRGYRPGLTSGFLSKPVRNTLGKMGAGVLGLASQQISAVISMILATGTVVGAVSWLNYAFRLFQFPVGVLGVSIASSNLVHFSKSYHDGNLEEASSTLKMSYDLSLMFTVPIALLLGLYAPEAVGVVFERGAFSGTDTLMSSQALRAYLFGLPAYGLYKVFVPTFYTLDRARVPVLCSVLSVIIHIALSVSLVDQYGFVILALTPAVGSLVSLIIQSILLGRMLQLRASFFMGGCVFKIMMASSLSFAASYFLRDYLLLEEASSLLILVCGGSLGAALYFAILWGLGERRLFGR